MKFCIYGAGAIGGLIGAHLARVGEDVTLIARGAHLAAMRETPYSRYPVLRGSDADVLGVLEVKSLLERLDERSPDLFANLRPAVYVSESTHALKLLEIFREEQQSLALVVDEYGDVTGMVTVNDLMGAVIGRIQSGENQDADPLVAQRDDGSLLVDGGLPVEEMRELLGGGSDIDRLDRAISSAHASQVQTVDLVDQAQQALAAGKLDGVDGAGALYQRVLRTDPGNAVATHGFDQVGNALAVQARKAFDAKDIDAANASIEQLAALQPNNGALPALRALQAQTRKQDNSALEATLKQGQDALRAGRIGGTSDETALAYFQAALKLDPDNAQAKAGLGKVAQAMTVQANAAIDAGDTAQATRLLDQAAILAPKSADLAAARARLASAASQPATARAADDSEAPPAPAALSPQQSAAVARLVQRAQVATKNGDIMMPPGDSAYDLYRSALAIDGNNEAALQGLQALPDQVTRQFNQALAAGNLGKAGDMLANLAELAPGDAVQGALSNRLASAWLDQAEQQLARGDRIGASQSLERARKLSPSNPRVLDLGARLQGGG